MQGYIYDPRTLVPIKSFIASSYKLPMEFVAGESGTIATTSVLQNYEQHFVKLDGIDNVWRVAAQMVRNDLTTLVIEDALSFFNGIGARSALDDGKISGSRTLTILGGSLTSEGGGIGHVNFNSPADKFLPAKIGVMSINGETSFSVFKNNNANGLNELASTLLGGYSGGDVIKYVATYSGVVFADVDVFGLINAIRESGYTCKANIVRTNDVSFGLKESDKVRRGTIIRGGGKFYRVTGYDLLFVEETDPADWVWEADGAPINYNQSMLYFDSPSHCMQATGSLDALIKRREKTPYGLDVQIRESNMSVLSLSLQSFPESSSVVIFGDGTHYLTEYSADSNDFVSHVIVPKVTGGASVAGGYHYYLSSSGSIVSSQEDQIAGQTMTIFGQRVNSWDSGLPLAEEEFAKNKVEHKLVFKSNKVYHVGQRIRAVMETETIDTIISSVMLTSDDDRRVYTCGLMATTASEKIKSNSWRYGQRLPLNPYVGQLVFT